MKGKIKTDTTKLYKNSRSGNSIPIPTEYEKGEFSIDIFNFDDVIDLTIFKPLYSSNDINRQHPYYFIDCKDKATKLDLKGNAATYIAPATVQQNGNIGEPIDSDMRFTYPIANPPEVYGKARLDDNNFNLIYRYQMNANKAVYDTSKTFKNHFNGMELVKGIQLPYDGATDTMTAPCAYFSQSFLNFYDDDNKIPFKLSATFDITPYLFATYKETVEPNTTNRALYVLKKDGDYERFIYPNIGTKTEDYTILYGNSDIKDPATDIGAPSPFMLLVDSNGEYWLMCITNIGFESLGEHGEDYGYIFLSKIKDLPIGLTPIEGIKGTPEEWRLPYDFTWSDLSQFDNFDNLIKLAFRPEGAPSYEEKGDPIIGIGDDPYDGILDNTTGIVGGRPNPLDEIQTDNGDYSNAPDRLRQTLPGYYGAYKLDAILLNKYNQTLTKLYEEASKNIGLFSTLGDIYMTVADRIYKNTTNLLILPYNVNGNTINTKFIVGNSGIINNTTDWAGYCIGTNFVDAPIIRTEIDTAEVDLGVISQYYDNFLDFAPYSSASLYIPYIGEVSLPINLIQSTSSLERHLRLLFRMNNTTGEFAVLLQSDNVTIQQWHGNCSKSIQLNVDDISGVIRAGASKLISSIASTSSLQDAITAPSDGNSSPVNQHQIGATSSAGDIGFLCPQDVMLTIERPIIWRPKDYGDLIGYPTKKIAKLSSVEGFATVSNIHLKCQATEDEKNELKRILAEGVIF